MTAIIPGMPPDTRPFVVDVTRKARQKLAAKFEQAATMMRSMERRREISIRDTDAFFSAFRQQFDGINTDWDRMIKEANKGADKDAWFEDTVTAYRRYLCGEACAFVDAQAKASDGCIIGTTAFKRVMMIRLEKILG